MAKAAEELDVSTAVIVPTVGRTFFALNMVMMLIAGTRRPDEIIIVDQTDADQRNPWAFANLKMLETQGHCRVVEHPVKSATVARNVGIREANADVLIFVDDDAFVPTNFVESYLEIFEDDRVDAATGMILVGESDHGTIDTTKVHPSQHDGHTMLRGGNFAVRKHVIETIGGLDENFVGAANHEDADLAYRLHEAGCNVVWAPAPWLFHLSYQGGGGRIKNPLKYRNFAYNLCYFHFRHFRRITFGTLASLLRQRVFFRDNLTRPWLLPARLRDFVSGYRLAKKAAAVGPKLPFSVAHASRQ